MDPVLVRELVAGSTRFNDLRRGVPRMSPALLSKRLKELEAAGVVGRVPVEGEPEVFEYRLTEAGRELKPVIEAVGCWGQRWMTRGVARKAGSQSADVGYAAQHRSQTDAGRPEHDSGHFQRLAEARRNWWLVVEPGKEVDLCSVDPGFDVDLFLSTDLRTMTEIWMGYTSISRAKEQGKLLVTGNRTLEASLSSWMSLSPFARIEKRVA